MTVRCDRVQNVSGKEIGREHDWRMHDNYFHGFRKRLMGAGSG